jgi:hypothetical protein
LPFTSISDTLCFGFLPTPRNEKNDFFCGSAAEAGAATGFAGAAGAALDGRGAACADAGFAARAVFLAGADFAALAGFFGFAAFRGGAAFRPTVFFAFPFMIPPCVSSIAEMNGKSKAGTRGRPLVGNRSLQTLGNSRVEK